MKNKCDIHQPFTVSLQAFNVKKLDSNRLCLQTKPEMIIYVALMHSSKPSFSQQEVAAEILSYGTELTQLKIKQIRAKRLCKILIDSHRRGTTEIGEGEPPERWQRSNVL